MHQSEGWEGEGELRKVTRNVVWAKVRGGFGRQETSTEMNTAERL